MEPCGEEVEDLLVGRIPDLHPATGGVGGSEESGGLEQAYRLAHRVAGDPEVAGQGALVDAIAGKQCALEDHVLESVGDLLGGRRGAL